MDSLNLLHRGVVEVFPNNTNENLKAKINESDPIARLIYFNFELDQDKL